MVVVVVTSFRQVAGWGVGFRGVTSEYPKTKICSLGRSVVSENTDTQTLTDKSSRNSYCLMYSSMSPSHQLYSVVTKYFRSLVNHPDLANVFLSFFLFVLFLRMNLMDFSQQLCLSRLNYCYKPYLVFL